MENTTVYIYFYELIIMKKLHVNITMKLAKQKIPSQ